MQQENTTEVYIKLLKYETDFCKRSKDLKTHHWFSFPNTMLTHPDFGKITGDELKAFLEVVCICSRVNSDVVRIDIEHLCHQVKIEIAAFNSMVLKLKNKQLQIIDDEEYSKIKATTAPRPQHDRTTASTVKYSNSNSTLLTSNSNSSLISNSHYDYFVNICIENAALSNTLKIINQDLIKKWVEIYDLFWLRKTLAKCVQKNMNSEFSSRGPAGDLWGRRLSGWLEMEKKPRLIESGANLRPFINGLIKSV